MKASRRKTFQESQGGNWRNGKGRLANKKTRKETEKKENTAKLPIARGSKSPKKKKNGGVKRRRSEGFTKGKGGGG